VTSESDSRDLNIHACARWYYIRFHFTLDHLASAIVYGVNANGPSHYLGKFCLQAAEVLPQPGTEEAY